VKEVIGVEDEVDAEGIPDQLTVKGAGEVIDQSMFEIPDIPQECRFVKGPLGDARNMGGEVARQRPGQQQREQGIEAQDERMAA
jgi:hypothetical protein